MRKLSLLMVAIFAATTLNVFAQAKLSSGDIKVLKGQTIVNMQYDYSNMAVGKFKNEQDYITDATAERNKKKPGTGDEWAAKWVSDREDKFQPTFEQNLNNETLPMGLKCNSGASDAKYTFICRTTFTEPGFNVGVTRKNAYITMVIDLVETANPDKVLATIDMKKENSISMAGYDFDTGTRIQSAYDRAGMHLGEFLVKNVLK